MHYFCSRKRNDRPMTEEQIQEKKKYAGEKRPSMKRRDEGLVTLPGK